jgi:hypothetical protein
MFDSLTDRMRHDQHEELARGEMLLRWIAVLVISFLVFGGLYYAVRMME